MDKKLISIVLPAYKEEKNIPIIYKELKKVLENISDYDFEIIFVNDWSPDETWKEIEKLAKDDKLIGAALISKGGEIILTSQKGQSIRFSEKEARAMKRSASGVIGMKISSDDKVVSLIPIELKEQKNKQQIIVISENGFGKKTNLGEYRKQWFSFFNSI